jgi:hypothetical protein
MKVLSRVSISSEDSAGEGSTCELTHMVWAGLISSKVVALGGLASC